LPKSSQRSAASAYRLAASFSGSARSDAAVNPTRSQNSTDTTFRSSCTEAAGGTVSGAVQNGQNGNSPGTSLPQEGQAATSRVYAAVTTDNSPLPNLANADAADGQVGMRMRGLEPPRPYGHTDLN